MNRSIKILITSTFSTITVLAIVFTTLKTIAYRKALNQFENYFLKEAERRKDKLLWTNRPDSVTLTLLKDRAYYSAQFEASKSDSICLIVNIPDSTVALYLKGVMVHSAKLEHFKISPLFKAINPAISNYAKSLPFKGMGQISTIRKMPLMVKIAPRDTSEYTPDVVPDTTDLEPVNFIIELKPNVQLYFYESNSSQSSDGFSHFKFDLKERIRTLKQDFKRISKFNYPVYKPYIRIRINKRDAKIIYRALPNKGQVILMLE